MSSSKRWLGPRFRWDRPTWCDISGRCGRTATPTSERRCSSLPCSVCSNTARRRSSSDSSPRVRNCGTVGARSADQTTSTLTFPHHSSRYAMIRLFVTLIVGLAVWTFLPQVSPKLLLVAFFDISWRALLTFAAVVITFRATK